VLTTSHTGGTGVLPSLAAAGCPASAVIRCNIPAEEKYEDTQL